MTNDVQLTEEEARTFLKLLEKVEADMDEAFEEAAAGIFEDSDGDDDEGFREQWGKRRGSMYTTCTRRKYRAFVEAVYLPSED